MGKSISKGFRSIAKGLTGGGGGTQGGASVPPPVAPPDDAQQAVVDTQGQETEGGKTMSRVYKRLCWSLAEAEQWVRRKVPTVQSFQSS